MKTHNKYSETQLYSRGDDSDILFCRQDTFSVIHVEDRFSGGDRQDWCMAVADYPPMIIMADNDLGIDLKFENFK